MFAETFSAVGSSGTIQSCETISHEHQSGVSRIGAAGLSFLRKGGGGEAVTTLLREQHPRITSIKGLARGYVWWLRMDQELEVAVKVCDQCTQHHKTPAKAPILLGSSQNDHGPGYTWITLAPSEGG